MDQPNLFELRYDFSERTNMSMKHEQCENANVCSMAGVHSTEPCVLLLKVGSYLIFVLWILRISPLLCSSRNSTTIRSPPVC